MSLAVTASPPHVSLPARIAWHAASALTAAGLGALGGSRLHPELLAALPGPSLGLAAVCFAAGIGAFVAFRVQRRSLLVVSLSLPLVALPIVLQPVIAALTERRSERALVELIRSELPTETEVIGLETWRPSVSFYLGRPVPIISRQGGELRSNYIVRTRERWFDPEGVLRPAAGDLRSSVRCDQPTVYLVHTARIDLQTGLKEMGLETIWTGPKLYAYFCDPLQPARSTAVPGPAEWSLDDG